MAPSREDSCFSRLALLAVLLFIAIRPAAAGLSLQYCSTVNTASTAANTTIYQSNGYCYNTCLADYAFAVLSGDDCYCSDYMPNPTTTLSDCYITCPGYPDDMCAGNGLFGYIKLAIAPSGTKGGSTTASSTPVPDSSTAASQVTVTLDGKITTVPVPVTVTVNVTPVESYSQDPLTTSSSLSSTSTTEARTVIKPTISTSPTSSSTSSSSSLTWTPTPSLSLTTVTGQVRTVTVTPTAPPSDSQSSVSKSTSSHALGTGPIIGIVIAALAMLALGIFIGCCCIRRRNTQKDDNGEGLVPAGKSSNDFIPPGGPTPPSRTMSENSRYILGTDGTMVVETFEDGSTSRRSRLLPVDPRVDPFSPLYQQGNKSRESVNTINDHQDYSRKIGPYGSRPILRAMNPDANDD